MYKLPASLFPWSKSPKDEAQVILLIWLCGELLIYPHGIISILSLAMKQDS